MGSEPGKMQICIYFLRSGIACSQTCMIIAGFPEKKKLKSTPATLALTNQANAIRAYFSFSAL
jgi:hypothetical protein